MRKPLLAAASLAALAGCSSIETATLPPDEVAGHGKAIAVIQANSIGLTAIFHLVDLVQSDLETVVNKLLLAEAKAMGATKVEIKSASTTPRHGVWAVFGPTILNFPLGVTLSHATGVALE
jgi:hypothetical protein